MARPDPDRLLSLRLPPRFWAVGATVAVAVAVVYGLLFPREPNLDPADISREAANFIAVLFVYAWARHDIRAMNAGFALVLLMLWVEVVDELTLEPRWVGTGLPAPVGILGLLLLAIGVREAAKLRRVELARRRDAEDALRHSLSTLKAVVENTPDAVWVKDPAGRYVLANTAFAQLIGRSAADLIGRSDAELFTTDPGAPGRSVARALESGAQDRFEETVAVRNEPHTFLVSRNAVRDGAGAAIGILGVARDISDRKAVEERLAHQAQHDELTGLPNRSAFFERLDRTLGRRRQAHGRPFAVLFVDIDRFKEANDRYGHSVGDELLAELARQLLHWVRPGDTVARFGGDEFTVILQDVTGHADALHVAERIREGLATPLPTSAGPVTMSVSVGVAIADGTTQRAEDVLREADAAMYQAKQAGGARHVVAG